MSAAAADTATLERLLGTAGQAITTDVLVLTADMEAGIAARELERRHVSGAPVIDHGRVVGVITLRDLLAPFTSAETPGRYSGPFLRYEHKLSGFKVWQLMSTGPATVRADQPLLQAVATMERLGVNRLPVVDAGGRPIGILARDDVSRAIARHARASGGEAAPPPVQPPAAGEQPRPSRPQTTPD